MFLGYSMNMLTYTKSGLSAGVSYRFVVTATNYIGESAESGVATIIAATVPDQITLAPTILQTTKQSISI